MLDYVKMSHLFAVGVCPQLPNPANGGSVNCTNGNYEMSVCTFSCPPGFRLRGISAPKVQSLSTTTCDKDGTGGVKWDTPVPYCEKGNTVTAYRIRVLFHNHVHLNSLLNIVLKST